MITDDAILVNMALDGKRGAFDELVRKHRSRVLSTARTLVGTTDGAEDVAQQAFVTAFANLSLLRDPASFRPWLMTITRRCATRQWTAQSRETTGLCETVMAFPCCQPIDDADVRTRIAEVLAELSALSRRIVVMHYLDGCSCREIGESLGMPPGTVKRLLHESRTSLRASSELTRGTDVMSQKNQGPRRMEWWISGDWPGNMVDTVLKQSICLTINKSGLTPAQIAKRVDANEAYVRETLDALEAEELVEKVGRGRYRIRFIAVGADDLVELYRDIRPKAERVADLLEEALPGLQTAWENSPKPAQGFDWNTGTWLTTAIMVCQFGRPRNYTLHVDPPPMPLHPASGKRYSAAGQEILPDEHRLWKLDLGLHTHAMGFSFGWLRPDGLGFGRRGITGSPGELRALFGAIASGSRDIGSAAEAAGLDMEKARELAASAIELGLLERADDGLALKFPLFASEDDEALLMAVDRAGRQVADVVDPIAHLVDEKLSEFGFDYLREQFGAWHGLPGYHVMAEGVRVLYKRGLLPFPGDPAPANFCMWGCIGETKLFTCSR